MLTSHQLSSVPGILWKVLRVNMVSFFTYIKIRNQFLFVNYLIYHLAGVQLRGSLRYTPFYIKSCRCFSIVSSQTSWVPSLFIIIIIITILSGHTAGVVLEASVVEINSYMNMLIYMSYNVTAVKCILQSMFIIVIIDYPLSDLLALCVICTCLYMFMVRRCMSAS